MDHSHNRPILTARSLHFRKPTAETMATFIELLESGLSEATLLQEHNVKIITENLDTYLIPNISPNHRWMSQLYRKVVDSNYGSTKFPVIKQAEFSL